MSAEYVELDELSELIADADEVVGPGGTVVVWQLKDGSLLMLPSGQDKALRLVPDAEERLEQLAQDHPSIELGLIVDRGIENNRVESARSELLERGVDPALIERIDWSWEGLERRTAAA